MILDFIAIASESYFTTKWSYKKNDNFSEEGNIMASNVITS